MTAASPAVIKINIHDSTAVKVCLDENIASYILHEFHLTPDHTHSNYKLAFGYLAVAVAMLAQFFPADHKYTTTVLIVCIAVYGVLQLVLQYVSYILSEHNTILVTAPSEQYQQAYIVTSAMPKYSTKYNLTVGAAKSNKHNRNTIELHVTNYFNTTGVLLTEKLFVDIEPFIKQALEQYAVSSDSISVDKTLNSKKKR